MNFFRFVFAPAAAAGSVAALLLSASPAMGGYWSVTYSYDSLGRLVQSTYPSSHAETYVYDQAGESNERDVEVGRGRKAHATDPAHENMRPKRSAPVLLPASAALLDQRLPPFGGPPA